MNDISELDDEAKRLRVSYEKSTNYMTTFTVGLYDIKAKIDTGIYGPEWNFERWVLVKIGYSTSQIYRRIKAHKDSLADDEKQKILDAAKKVREAKEQIRLQKQEELAIERRRKADERAEREAAIEAIEKKKIEAARIKADIDKKARRNENERARYQQKKAEKAAQINELANSVQKSEKSVAFPANGSQLTSSSDEWRASIQNAIDFLNRTILTAQSKNDRSWAINCINELIESLTFDSDKDITYDRSSRLYN